MTKWWHDGEYRRALPRHESLISQAEMVARIEAARIDAAPAYCEACGSTTPEARPERKRCPRCELVLPSYRFWKNRTKPDGLSVWCSTCGAQYAKDRRTRLALHALRIAS